tara:strand:- start:3773 stop:5083 length:1311 start_codon:yes stop_codon:yes gene_type:complete
MSVENVLSEWIKDEADNLNKSYSQVQKIFFDPTARGHKSMRKRWSAFRRTLPFKDIQVPEQLFSAAAPERSPITKFEEPEPEAEAEGPVSPRTGKKKRKYKRKPKTPVELVIEEEEEEAGVPAVEDVVQYRPMTRKEIEQLERLTRIQDALRSILYAEMVEYGGQQRDNAMQKRSGQLDRIKADIDALREGTRLAGTGVGKGLSAKNLKELLKASYSPKDKVGDFVMDKSLSSKTSKVYQNPQTGQVVVAHQGTQGWADWGNNLVYAVGGKWAYEKTPRYKEAKKVQEEAQQKYGAKNITTIGHSQAGLQAEMLGKDTKEIITLNKASRPFSNTKAPNQFDLRSKLDIVSSLNPFESSTSRDVKIHPESLNPLTEHSTDVLERLDPEAIIGIGLRTINHQLHKLRNTKGKTKIDKMFDINALQKGKKTLIGLLNLL